MRLVVPMDVHERSIMYAALDGSMVLQRPRRIQNEPDSIRLLARSWPSAEFVIEACGLHESVVDLLREENVRVVAIQPPKREKRTPKSDGRDTLRIGQKRLSGEQPVVFVPTPNIRRLRDVIHHRRVLVGERTKLMTRMRAELVRWRFSFESVEKDRARVIHAFPHLESAYNLLDALEPMIKRETKRLREMSDTFPPLRRLRSIPGFGDVVAPAFFAKIADINRFKDGHAIVGYLGGNPLSSQSGERSTDLHRISKHGDPYVRGLLTEAAWVHTRFQESEITQGFNRLVHEKNKPPRIAIGYVWRHLVLAAHDVWKEDRDFTMKRPKPPIVC